MSNNDSKEKKARGFAGIIAKNLEPVNNKKRFKEKFKDYENFKILINANDGRYAALILIDHGTLKVDGFKNNDKVLMKKLKKESDGFLEMKTDLFFKLTMGELSNSAIAKKWLTRKIKVKKTKNVMLLKKIFYYTTDAVE